VRLSVGWLSVRLSVSLGLRLEIGSEMGLGVGLGLGLGLRVGLVLGIGIGDRRSEAINFGAIQIADLNLHRAFCILQLRRFSVFVT